MRKSTAGSIDLRHHKKRIYSATKAVFETGSIGTLASYLFKNTKALMFTQLYYSQVGMSTKGIQTSTSYSYWAFLAGVVLGGGGVFHLHPVRPLSFKSDD